MSATNLEQINAIISEWEARTVAELSGICDQHSASSDEVGRLIRQIPAAMANDLKTYVTARLNIAGSAS